MTFLAPQFLVSKIPLIALLLGTVLLVIFSDFMNKRVIFPISDVVRDEVGKSMRMRARSRRGRFWANVSSEGLATIIFIFYCYFGSSILAEYVFAPIMYKLRAYTLIVVIVLFLIVSYIINNPRTRNKFLKV